MKRQWFVLIAIVLLAIVAIYETSSANKEQLPAIGYKAPQFSLIGLDGQTYSTEQLKNMPVVINFWASWCGPCKIEAPELVQLYEKYKGQLEIYAVNVTAGDKLENAQAFVEKYGLTFPVLIDDKGTVSSQYYIAPIPTTFFVDRRRTIVDILYGIVDSETLEGKFKRTLR